MEIPSRVSVFNKTLEIKGKPGMLVAVSESGYFEVNLQVQERNHTVLLPINETVLIFNDPIPDIPTDFEVER
ncbi:MAG TPA: hypothetical protein VM557_04785 [Thermoanaerobaculia bacterium]|nr:hypothetical protein [Thermoanaerobaculia bacterium]